jgi:hypothetical protein
MKIFKVGDWIRAKSGINKGKTTTITYISDDAYCGYYCGNLIFINFEDAANY